MKTIESPQDLLDELVDIFPGIDPAWASEVLLEAQENHGFHAIFFSLSSEAFGLLERAKPRQVKRFGDLINHCVDSGGLLENAVSTCLLEHASQVGIRTIIKPHLSKLAKDELR